MTQHLKHQSRQLPRAFVERRAPVRLVVALWCTVSIAVASSDIRGPSAETQRHQVGREVSVPAHLRDGEEISASTMALLSHGERLFKANWTEEEGGGRPLTKGTG